MSAGCPLNQLLNPLEPLPPIEDVPWWRFLWWAFLVLAPVSVLGAGLFWWRNAHEDPWLGLLRWGRRHGRPLGAGETPLEYGTQLGEFVVGQNPKDPEVGRIAAREMRALGEEVSGVQYAPAGQRAQLQGQAKARWDRLRGYLRTLRK